MWSNPWLTSFLPNNELDRVPFNRSLWICYFIKIISPGSVYCSSTSTLLTERSRRIYGKVRSLQAGKFNKHWRTKVSELYHLEIWWHMQMGWFSKSDFKETQTLFRNVDANKWLVALHFLLFVTWTRCRRFRKAHWVPEFLDRCDALLVVKRVSSLWIWVLPTFHCAAEEEESTGRSFLCVFARQRGDLVA